MTDRPKQNFDENAVPKLVRELPAVEADADFRARLRNAFVEGRLEAKPVPERPSGQDGPLLGWLRWLVPVAAAAVVLITFIMMNRPPALRIAQVTGRGEVLVNGRAIDVTDEVALSAALRAGAEIETPPGALIDVIAGNVVLFEVTGGTHMTIPPVPGRWFGSEAACSLLVGEIRLKTGKDFPGRTLTVYTPEGITEITGTLLSVQRGEGGTCVCVLEGVAHVGVDKADMQAVEPGYRKVMHSDGTEEIIPVLPLHRDGVLDFDKRVGNRIERER